MKPNKPITELSDLEVRDLLLAQDKEVTEWFYFKKCSNLFKSIIKRVFNFKIEYEEYVNEIYAYLMENDAQRLKSYDGRGSLYSWMKKVIYNHSVKINKENLLIEDVSHSASNQLNEDKPDNNTAKEMAKLDFSLLIDELTIRNEKYAYVLKKSMIEDTKPVDLAEELGITVKNLYNIKSRAIKEMTEIALGEPSKSGKKKQK